MNIPKEGCEGGVEYLTGVLGLKRDLVCNTLVDSIVDKTLKGKYAESWKQWVRKRYNKRGTCIDRFSTKFSDICGCSCSS